ncbi:MAG TPA: class I SAM-dependent methyltransferase [Phycisphaerae bacterium]|nr:class I SAM-dependent methyltransferase [Phycisphaerae bacterium]HRY70329.1 class I SAM-dependent methyltransferase [Phycisphaerae bacterium]HSA28046.1 class I SAM-dependent methyltransferase [Phycisphaerae bacterium]
MATNVALRHGRSRGRLTARTADRHLLYSEAVQCAASEIKFLRRVYRKANGRLPLLLREDFCGTGLICAHWVKAGPANRAIGVDLDPEPLGWSRSHLLSRLTRSQRARVRLHRADVLAVQTPPVDVIVALNFSFCVFKRRPLLLEYFRQCRDALKAGGLLVLDIYGGPESHRPNKEKTRYQGFTYVWEQVRYNPITSEALNHIHFAFPDGSRMMKAFTYDWRLWTLAELQEGLLEVGFRQARVYWEGATSEGTGNGIFRCRRQAEVEDAWVAYVVGFR